jgi:hypothetical protein
VGDFDGDTFDDLAVGVRGEKVDGVAGSVVEAGAAHVFFGSASRLTGDADKLLHQDTPQVENEAEASDHFGSALSSGNFDGDAYDDLAVGVPNENILGASGSIADAGAVNVLYGSSLGPIGSRDQFWHQNVVGVEEVAEGNDLFGTELP